MPGDDYDGPYSFDPFRSAWLASAVVVLGRLGMGLAGVYQMYRRVARLPRVRSGHTEGNQCGTG